MAKGTMKYRGVGVLIALLLASTYAIGVRAVEKLAPDGQEKARADIIEIDTLKTFGDLDKPEVIFLHDAHTEALDKKGKDCTACHLPQSNKIPGDIEEAVKGIDPLSPKFKRLEDTARKEVMDIYHTFCIDCHTQMKAEGDESGPVTCGKCHQETDRVSTRQPMGFDRSLHYRHSKTQEKKCERCHHKYDAEAEKLVYDKGNEGTCRYCHLEADADIPPYVEDKTQISKLSMREASHLDCIECHRKMTAKKQKAGPIQCRGCHSPEAQAKIETVKDIPRMERKQPDMVLVKTGEPATRDDEDLGAVRMNAVPYNHKAHEAYNDTCRVCHHASMETCSRCHTIGGSKLGDEVKLEQAYHMISSRKSCLGCHEENKQQGPKCSGCHYFMSPHRKQKDETCLKCHQEMTDSWERTLKKAEKKEDSEAMKELAEEMLKDRTYLKETYSDEDIPEKLVIKEMMDQYEGAEFPHRKIVKKLQSNISEDKLAGFFHSDKGTLCQGCHHNSPPSKKPPKCVTCHGKPFDQNNPLRPGLLAAYHRQCMTCHEQMKIEKPTGCTGCHKKNPEKS